MPDLAAGFMSSWIYFRYSIGNRYIEACVVLMILRPMFLAAACGQEMIVDIGCMANTMIRYVLNID
jgi:hypothetical protein